MNRGIPLGDQHSIPDESAGWSNHITPPFTTLLTRYNCHYMCYYINLFYICKYKNG